ncbi:hypothetical protein MBLNU459_g2050t1 [Dothideomycetes sp. NU459]
MGIQGLLPLLKSIHKPCSLKSFAGQTIGVDAYGWLHRGTIACAVELAQDKPTTKWLDFVMNRVRMLVHFGVKPYLVFDGDYLPSKAGTEKERASRRRESRKNGLEMLRLGRTSQAQLELQKSIDVTPVMARQLIEELKKLGIAYVVAPYEADSQMAFLEKRGIIDAILSEDSDLLVFGAKCLLTKLDQYGDCVMIDRKDFTACREISLVGWTDADFRCMAILSGCDYLPGIDKMGLKTAYHMIRKHKTVDRIVKSLGFDGKMKVPSDYLEAFSRAEATFLYQWVYCPDTKSLVHLNQPRPDVDIESFTCIGKHVESKLAAGVATGQLHPHTKQPIVLPDGFRVPNRPPLRSSVSVSTPDLKKHRPIDAFFHPRRTPLAELDPNSFTPSPSQQQLLQHGPVSWSAEPVTRRPLLARNASAVTGSAPQRVVRRSLTDAWSQPATKSPKRQRLCSDGYFATPSITTERVESGTSRFFSSGKSNQSPSLRRGTGASRKSSEDFNLWSDDSVELAMSQLIDVPTEPLKKKSSKKLDVFKDGSLAKRESDDTVSLRKPTTASFDESKLGNSLFSAGLATDIGRLRAESCKTEDDENETSSAVHKPSLSIGKYAFEMRSPAHASDPISSVVPCSSPITGDGRDADSAKVSENHNVEAPACEDFDEADWLAAESRPLASLVRQRRDLESGEISTRAVVGSEDLLVPDSEGEEDGLKHTGFSFSLAQFAFSG